MLSIQIWLFIPNFCFEYVGYQNEWFRVWFFKNYPWEGLTEPHSRPSLSNFFSRPSIDTSPSILRASRPWLGLREFALKFQLGTLAMVPKNKFIDSPLARSNQDSDTRRWRRQQFCYSIWPSVHLIVNKFRIVISHLNHGAYIYRWIRKSFRPFS